MLRSVEPMTCGGGPPAPRRNEGKKRISPTACAAARRGENCPEQYPDAHECHGAEPERCDDLRQMVHRGDAVDGRSHDQEYERAHRDSRQPGHHLGQGERPPR